MFHTGLIVAATSLVDLSKNIPAAGWTLLGVALGPVLTRLLSRHAPYNEKFWAKQVDAYCEIISSLWIAVDSSGFLQECDKGFHDATVRKLQSERFVQAYGRFQECVSQNAVVLSDAVLDIAKDVMNGMSKLKNENPQLGGASFAGVNEMLKPHYAEMRKVTRRETRQYRPR